MPIHTNTEEISGAIITKERRTPITLIKELGNGKSTSDMIFLELFKYAK
jgi:hypothetical protein